ncbi:MAG: SRPBCC domain-containing protein [Candidatus Obscuribacterales bacterium]|nr:SRPBCC domain-containing protein [Candidatus Obscuribacterales bacterium]
MYVIESTCTSESLKIKRVIAAPIARVYQAWVDPQKLAKWFGCNETNRVEAELDLRVGGKYTIKMFCDQVGQNLQTEATAEAIVGAAAGAAAGAIVGAAAGAGLSEKPAKGSSAINNCNQENVLNIAKGEYLEIEPDKKLVFTWTNNFPEFPADNTLVTIEFKDLGGKTELTLTHSRFMSAKSVEGHSYGWSAALEKLDNLDFSH